MKIKMAGIEFEYTDKGQISPGVYRSTFRFDGKELHNDVLCKSNIANQRFISDKSFLRLYGFDLEKAVIEWKAGMNGN
jgi:hypothetical protein